MKQLLCTVFCFAFISLSVAQTDSSVSVDLQYRGSDGMYYLVERSDISRYDNGKYSGLMRREVRSRITQAQQIPAAYLPQIASIQKRQPGGTFFSGSFYVLEETVRNNVQTVRGISADIPSSFYIAPDGILTIVQDEGFPVYRSFPAYPQKSVQPDMSWQNEAIRSVDPLNTGTYTRLKILVQYTFKGQESYKNEQVYRIAAKWATRYGGSYYDRNGDANLKNAIGTHDADILVSVATGSAVLIRDRMDETFSYANGSTVRLKGVSLFFTEYPPSIQKDDVINILRGIAGVQVKDNDTDITVAAADTVPGIHPADINPTSLPDSFILGKDNDNSGGKNSTQNDNTSTAPVIVEKTDDGVRLSIRNLRFKPDSAEMLPSETQRLDDIASVLLQAPEAIYLVEGHTASAGKPTGEQTLSQERAEKTAAELSKRGIRADRFICIGRGSTRPVSDGTTETERAQNRRVEITILM